MRYFHTEPFNPAVSEGAAAGNTIAKTMGEVINRMSEQGWVFQSYESVQITVNPGCLAIFSGPRLANYGVMVFFQDR